MLHGLQSIGVGDRADTRFFAAPIVCGDDYRRSPLPRCLLLVLQKAEAEDIVSP